jgi:4-diphosphocytidyl-2-C-methyl-D-erythritol kinase
VHRRAYAKLNLSLSVGPFDPRNRLHPLESWMHCIDLFDDIHVEPRHGEPRGASRRPAKGSEIETSWAPDAPRPTEIDWGPEEDLAIRALRILEAHTHEPLPVRMRVVKRIPVGGGLGGGSADAAAVMLAANELFGLGLSLASLVRLSRGIGSDVGFFLDDVSPARPAFVRGFGEQIDRRDRAEAEVVLILPPFGCATREVYQLFDTLPPPAAHAKLADLAGGGALASAALFNDLAAAAETLHPELTSLRSRLVAAISEPVHMTGSGSTLFVVTGDPVGAVQRLSIAAPEAVVIRTRLV